MHFYDWRVCLAALVGLALILGHAFRVDFLRGKFETKKIAVRKPLGLKRKRTAKRSRSANRRSRNSVSRRKPIQHHKKCR